MANQENRSLQILVKMRDTVTRPLAKITKAFIAFGRRVTGIFKRLFSALTSMKALLGGVVAVLAARAAWDGLKTIAVGLDEIIKNSDRLQFTTESLSGLRYVTNLAAVDINAFSSGLAQFSKNIEAARDGAKKQVQAFEELGVSIRNLPMGQDGKLDIIELLAQTADGLQSIEDPARRVNNLLVAFGKQGAKLGPLLVGGGDAIREQFETAKAYGTVFDRKTLERAAAFNDALARFDTAIQGLKETLFVEIAPEIAAVFEKLAVFVRDNRTEIIGWIGEIGNAFKSLFSLILDGIIGLVDALESIPGVTLVDDTAYERQKGYIRNLDAEMQKLIDRQEEIMRPLRERPGDRDPLTGRLTPEGQQRAFDASDAEAFLIGPITEQIRELLAKREVAAADAAKLQAVVSAGLASTLQATRERIASELAAISAGIRETPAPPRPQARTDLEGPSAFGQMIEAAQERKKLLELNLEMAAYEEQTRAVIEAQRGLRNELELLKLQEKLLPLVEDGTLTWQQYADAVRLVQQQQQRLYEQSQEGTFFSNFQRGLQNSLDQWKDFAGAVERGAATLTNSALSGLGNAFADIITGTKSAKEAFRDYALSLLRQIASLIPQLLIIKMLKTAFGMPLADGGVTPGLAGDPIPARAFADGGIARRPTFALFGEAGEEAFVPLKSGAIPVKMEGGRGDVIFAPTINAMDGESVQRVLVRERETIMAIWNREFSRTPDLQNTVRRFA